MLLGLLNHKPKKKNVPFKNMFYTIGGLHPYFEASSHIAQQFFKMSVLYHTAWEYFNLSCIPPAPIYNFHVVRDIYTQSYITLAPNIVPSS